MSRPKPLRATRLSPDRRITEIIAAARALMAEKGYENFVTTEVAARCGVSEATIFRYFPTKRDLLLKVSEDWFSEIISVQPDMSKYTETFDRLRYVIWYSLSIVSKEPVLTRFILMELRSDPTYRSMPIYQLNRQFTASIVKLIDDAIAGGEFRNDIPPKLVRDMIFGSIEHRTWAYLRGEGGLDVEESADAIAKIIFRGMTKSPDMTRRDADYESLAKAFAVLEQAIKDLEQNIRTLRGRHV